MVLVSSGLAPVFLIGGWILAARRQPATYDSTRDTISALAAIGADDRWLMTTGLVGLGLCHLVTASGLWPVSAVGRVMLAVGGVATVLVAAFPQPREGSSPAHMVAALVAFVALTLWPAFGRFPLVPGIVATVVIAGLLAWFGVELFSDGARIGLSERALAAAQALWPLCVAVTLVARPPR